MNFFTNLWVRGHWLTSIFYATRFDVQDISVMPHLKTRMMTHFYPTREQNHFNNSWGNYNIYDIGDIWRNLPLRNSIIPAVVARQHLYKQPPLFLYKTLPVSWLHQYHIVTGTTSKSIQHCILQPTLQWNKQIINAWLTIPNDAILKVLM